MRRITIFFIAASIIAGGFIFILPAAAQAQSAGLAEQEQLAALASQVETLRRLFEIVKQKLARPALAVAACSDGIDNDNDGQTDYPADTGCYGADDPDEAYNPLSQSSCYSQTTQSACQAASCTWYVGHHDGTHCDDAAHGSTASPSSPSGPPGTPLSVTATYRAGSNDVEVSWYDNSYEDQFKISRRTPGGSWTQWGTAASVAGTRGYYYDAAITAGATYEYHVNACLSGTCSTDSATVSVTIPSGGQTTTGTSTTSTTQTTTTTTGTTQTTTTTTTTTGSANLAASVSGSDVTLTWTDFYQGEDEYQIERRVGTGAWVKIGTSPYLAGGNGTYRDVNVSSGTYDYHVKPCTTSSGCFGESNTARVTVGGSSTSTTAPTTAIPPPVIANIAVSNITSNSATIGWTTDITANSKVEYGIGTATNFVSDGSFVTNHVINLGGLTASTTYTYNVISENTDYYRTTFSNRTFATLSSTPTFSLVGPTGLAARLESNGIDVMLSWTDNSYEETYTVERRRSQENWVVITSMPSQAGTGSYLDRSIPAGLYGSYEYRVKACGGGACSPESNIAAVTVTGSTSSSCDTALTALLGTGCHYMYSDSAGNSIYCDGPMTKSAKRGDTVTTPGCTFSGTPTGAQCSDGKDNDGDGLIDYPKDPSCYGPDDSDEYYPTSGQTGTTTPTAIPAVPTNVTAVQSGSDVALSWNDNAVNEDRYQVEWYNGTYWVTFGSTGIIYGGRGTYTDRSPSAKTHQYRVKACNSLGCSAESNVVSITIGVVSTPMISALSPASGPIGTKVVLTGSGFTPTGNRVNFDTGVIPELSSPDGKTITFVVPADRVPYCAITEPRCLLPAPYNPVKPGTYWISVVNANGTSGAMQFSVIETVAAVFSVDRLRTSPASGSVNMTTASRIQVRFTREFDPSSTVKEFFRLYKTATPALGVSGSFAIFPDGFEFVPSAELESNSGYTYTVLAAVRDRSGTPLSAPYTVSFTTGGVSRSSATLTGKVTDAEGAAVAKAYIHVYSPFSRYVPTADAYAPYQNFFSRNTATDEAGSYELSLPAGTYVIEAYAPSARPDLTRVAPREVTVGAGETRTANFAFGGAIKVITGTVSFSNGRPVTDAQAGAYASETRQWTSASTDGAGIYKLKVSGGTWVVGIYPRDPRGAAWSWDEKPKPITFSKDQISETKILDFAVPLRDATLSVSAVDETGAPFGNVGIIADTHSASSASTFFSSPPEFRIAAGDGKAKFILRAGTYYLRAFVSRDRGYFNPDEQVVTLAGGEIKETKLVFRKKQAATALTVSGVTKIEEGVLVDAFVWAWSERGGFASARADELGKFSFNVTPNERWHIGAGKEYKSFPYKSPELLVEVKTQPVTIELVLTKQALVPLPPTVSVTQAAAQQIVAQATDGASVTLPPGGAASSGTVQVEIKPTVEAPSQAGSDVVSTVYDVSIHDSAGNAVTTLSHEAEIVIPYNEADLKEQGVTEDTIVPSYFDEKTGTWVNLEGCTIDKERNAAICRVDHLTRFAITARADTTPPASPGSVAAAVLGGGKVKVSWKNPVKDFDYAKVYRSVKAGDLGTVRAATLSASQFVDSEGLSDGATYYYTVRAVDPAGNESANTGQVSVVAKGTSGAAVVTAAGAKGMITRTLRRGVKGDDVKILQMVLVKEGYLAAGSDTGFFGSATEAALKKYQTKLGLEAVGIAGPATRKKLNELR